MTKDNGYVEWADHPRWKELVDICGQYERLQEEAERLRAIIRKDVYGDEEEK